jgi:tetratricopeptide (TPR) repeat protein
MHRHFCSVRRLLVVAFLFCAGCPAETKPEKYVDVTRVSQNGANFYFQGKAQYATVRAQDLTGEPLKTEMDKVVTDLDAAIVNDPKCPLFYGKRGETFIELGKDGYPRAELDLNQAMKLSEDWVPSWIGLADLEARRGQASRARQYLDGASKSIESLQKKVDTKPPPPFRIMGLSIAPDAPPERKPDDPSLEESERRQLLLTWLQESEQWTIDSPALLYPAHSGTGFTVNNKNLFRRLRARIEYEKIVIRLREGAKPAEVLPMFDKVFDWDPDYFPARIEKAAQFRYAGEPREAERMLRPYVDSKDPKLANNCRLLYEMAAIYTDWYELEGGQPEGEKASKLADESFTRLFTVNERHATGWIKRAELYAYAGARSHRPDTLKDARRWLGNAREILKTDTPEMVRISQRIDDAEKGKSTTTKTSTTKGTR